MGSFNLRATRLLLLLLTLWSGQAPLLLLGACARLPGHSGTEAFGAMHQHRSPDDDQRTRPEVHLCCNLCGIVNSRTVLHSAPAGTPQPAVLILVATGTPFGQPVHGLGDIHLLPPALGPPTSST